jgi:hypothetical protein
MAIGMTVLGLVLVGLRGCPHQEGATYSFGEWQSALATGETKQQFAAAHAALVAHLDSLGFVEDTTYVHGTISDGWDAAGETQDVYVRTVDETELRLFTECFGGDQVGLWAQWSYLAAGPRTNVENTVAKIEQLKRDLTAWLEAYEREHPMPE